MIGMIQSCPRPWMTLALFEVLDVVGPVIPLDTVDPLPDPVAPVVHPVVVILIDFLRIRFVLYH